MGDPLSAIACIGFSVQILDTLARAISNFDKRKDEIREYPARLQHHARKLQNANAEWRAWHQFWFDDPKFPDSTYAFFWGETGYQEVKARVRTLLELSEQIRQLLPHSHSRSDGQCSVDEEFPPFADPEINGPNCLLSIENFDKPGLLRKIGFTLFTNAALKEKIQRFKSQVQGLRGFSMYSFKSEQKRDLSENVSRADLQTLDRRFRFFRRISVFAQSLLYNRQRVAMDWSAELAPPSPYENIELWEEFEPFYIDFFVRETRAQPTAVRVRLYLRAEDEDLSDITHKLASQAARSLTEGDEREGPGIPSNADLYEGKPLVLLSSPTSRSRSLRRMITDGVFSDDHRKSFDIERANLIYGLAHWWAALRGTNWLRELCACGIHCVRSHDLNTRHTFQAGRCRNRVIPRGYTCQHSKYFRDLALGLTICEIALAIPVGVHGNSTYPINVGRNESTTQDILLRLRRLYGRNTITKAVQYCLSDERKKDMEKPQVYQVQSYIEHVLHPIASYHRIVVEHATSDTGKHLRPVEKVNEYYASETT